MFNINPNIEVLEKYITANTKILHKCNKHNIEFEAYPTNILRGCGCKECGKEKIIKKNTLSEKDFKIRLQEDFGTNIFLVGKYTNLSTPTLFGCINGHNWETSPRCIVNMKHGCPKCAISRNSDKAKKTLEKYKEEVSLNNPFVTVLGNKYTNNNTPLLHKCNICGYEWNAIPNNILKGHGCKKCAVDKSALKQIKSHADFIRDFISNNSNSDNIEILSKYKGSHNTILCKCLICNKEWEAIATNLLKGSGCPCCKSELISKIQRKPQQLYEKELENFNIKLLEPYTTANIARLHKCLLCGYEWNVRPNNILTGQCRCPNCYKENSKGEYIILTYLSQNQIKYISHKTFDNLRGVNGGLLSYDFYLTEYNLLIEFQGIQHEYPVEHFGGKEQFKIQQEHDKRKRQYAQKQNIDLLEIWYYEINNTEAILTRTLNNLKSESLTTAGQVW